MSDYYIHNTDEETYHVLDSRFSIRIYADQPWQKTNYMIVSKEKELVLVQASGTWYVNPYWGAYRWINGNGNDKYKASGTYPMPGVNEGSLIGRVGRKIFFIGNEGYVPKGLEGELELVCNDELNGPGAGIHDNKGFLQIKISKVLIEPVNIFV